MISKILRPLLYWFGVWPLVHHFLGLWVRNPERLRISDDDEVILIANHNSHLDTLVMLSLFPKSVRARIRPVAAADYWMKGGIKAWFSRNVLKAIGIERGKRQRLSESFAPITEALDNGDIPLIFPEGTRGEAEQRQALKRGIAYLAEQRPNAKFLPVYLHNLGRALPRNEALLVPFRCDVVVGEPICWCGDRAQFMDSAEGAFTELEGSLDTRCEWS